MQPTIFIQTNHRQRLGAEVSRYSLKRNSAHPGGFDVHIMDIHDHPFFAAHEGQSYLRDGERRVWLNDDLQSFTPLRFMPPELMDYQGRALVIDPDVFAVGDVWELLSRDMQDKAVLCRRKGGFKGKHGAWATSVMLLDCARLTHWRVAEQFDEMFTGRRDYMDWISLKLDPQERIGELEACWNDFDHLDSATRLLHNTRRKTQPWKTGLPVDYRPADSFRLFPPRHWFRRARRALFGDYRFAGQYKQHPDPAQEALFFGLLKECLAQGIVSQAQLEQHMQAGYLRPDASDVLARVPALPDAA